MTFKARDGHGAQALEFNQLVDQLLGRGVIAGGRVTPSDLGSHVVELEATAVYLNGVRHDLSQQTQNLAGYIEDKPRKVILYVSTEGELEVAGGTPEDPRPRDEYRFNTYRPAPPDLRHMDAVPLAEVWLSPEDTRTTSADIRSRSFDADIKMHAASVEELTAETIIDGAGVEHTGELADAEDVPTEATIRDVIDADVDHGWDAPHNYFSGSHADLTDVTSDDHHPRYDDEEARSAVRGILDAADLDGASGASGQHLTWTGTDVQWLDAPDVGTQNIISAGTFTHSGGSDTTTRINGVTTDPTAQFEVFVGTNTDPTWSANHGYTVETSRQWDATAGAVDVEISVDWTEDPGAGNDLDLAYTVWESAPGIAESFFDAADAVAAVEGQSLSPRSVVVSDRLNHPVYDELGDPIDPEPGDVVVMSGNGSASFGIYVHDGEEWDGPLGTSITALSELTINTAKNWNGHPIVNVGAPSAARDVARVQELTDHAAVANAHHEKTTSSDIDHANISNVRPDQHHSPPTTEEIIDSCAGQVFSVPLLGASVPVGEAIRNYIYLAPNETLHLVRGEYFNDFGNSPNNQPLEVAYQGNDAALYEQTAHLNRGSVVSPLLEVEGSAQLEVRIVNNSGSTKRLSGIVSYVLTQN